MSGSNHLSDMVKLENRIRNLEDILRQLALNPWVDIAIRDVLKKLMETKGL
jgi:hypothetical protein